MAQSTRIDERSALMRPSLRDVELGEPVGVSPEGDHVDGIPRRRLYHFGDRIRWLQRQWWFSWGALALIVWMGTIVYWSVDHTPTPHFRVRFLASAHPGPITGRLVVCIAMTSAVKDPFGDDQPRFLVVDGDQTQQAFAVDVWGFEADDDSREINASAAVGYPVMSMLDVPAGEYWVQATLQPYAFYNRSDGYRLWLPAQHTFEYDAGVLRAPGTLYSRPLLAKYTPTSKFAFDILLDQLEPPVSSIETQTKNKPDAEKTDRDLLQHVKFRSERLSKFWGTDVFLQAWVLLPHKFYDASTAHIKYPLFLYHSHFSADFEFDYLEDPPQDPAKADVRDLYGYYLFSNWTSDDQDSAFFKRRGILVQIQHATPYYDDSYAVNSANMGPYGDAITYEFLPFIEQKFRGIGQGWARTLYGGSTGGWESLAVQVLYPDEYNGCWSFCPDSFDFHKFQLVDLLNDDNAYYQHGNWTIKSRGSVRDYLGNIRETMEEENHRELVMGSRGRSGGQWDAWQAVYSPVNTSDGYPAAIWDKKTGVINREVVQYWEDHYDIHIKLQREWESGLGEKLVRKLHIYVGMLDSYYLNDGVYILDDFLRHTTNPYYDGVVKYGSHDGKGYEHCWTGSYNQTLGMAWNTLNQRMVPKMVDHILRSAPPNVSLDFTTY